MEITFSPAENKPLEIPLSFIVIDGDNFSVVNKTVKVEMRENTVAIPLIEEHIKSFNDCILYINALSNVAINKDSIENDNFRIKGLQVKKLASNFIGSLNETLKHDLTVGIFSLLKDNNLDFQSLGVSVSVSDVFISPLFDRYPFFVVADFGDGLKSHKIFVSWSHNDLYSTNCASCQAGVSNLIRGTEYINHRVILPQSTKKGKSKVFNLSNGVTITVFNNHFEYLETTKKVTPQDFTKWFTQMFLGAVEMAHVKEVTMLIDGKTYKEKGTDE